MCGFDKLFVGLFGFFNFDVCCVLVENVDFMLEEFICYLKVLEYLFDLYWEYNKNNFGFSIWVKCVLFMEEFLNMDVGELIDKGYIN